MRANLLDDNAIALTVALDPFIDERCLTCGATGYFRFHVLGRMPMPGTVVHPNRPATSPAISSLVCGGHDAWAGKRGETRGTSRACSRLCSSRRLRLAFGLLLLLVQAALSLASSSRSKGAAYSRSRPKFLHFCLSPKSSVLLF